MRNLLGSGAATAICAIVAVSGMPSESWAGVMSVTGKSSVSIVSPTDQVHWRRYYHRHYGWHRHYRYYRYGYYPYYYNPAGVVAGTAFGLATAPLWGWGWGYPYW